ncbi:MAG: NAD(P)-dependent oxidoreductase, partial [Chloroflexi bacterium]|nr:NAD(P)-dependent oxidoreductase [Chloroflexota bacterium]
MITTEDRRSVDRKARIQIPPQPLLEQPPAQRVQHWDEVALGFADEHSARIEASRCLQCPAAPCVSACPLHNAIPDALWHAEQGDFLSAARVFAQTSTMPEVCGRVCPQERLCEGACVLAKRRAPGSRAVAIGRLEAMAADARRKADGDPVLPVTTPDTGKRVAVVGAGPAGLTVAELLRHEGHAVTVYDVWPNPGGVLLYGIPSFKLDRSLVAHKAAQLAQMGIRFIGNCRIGQDLSVTDLLAQGYDAVFLGHGASACVSPRVPGETLSGVYRATDFLVGAHPPSGEQTDLRVAGQQIVVIGGGDTAMDCTRTAVRLGAAGVTCVYRRSREQMPAREAEYHHALEEGVQFIFLADVVRFVNDGAGHIRSVLCQRQELGPPDHRGRPQPRPLPGSEFTIAADLVVLAVGYRPDPQIKHGIPCLELTDDGRVVVINSEGTTPCPGVFAGGDCVNGADLVVTAIAGGKRAA